VPIVLAIFPLMAGVPEARTLFNIAFVLVLASLLIQGASVRLAARVTAVGLPPLPEPTRQARWGRASHMMEFRLAEGMPPVGTTAQDYDWPRGVQALAVRRVEHLTTGGSALRWIDAQEAGALVIGDAIVLLVANDALEAAAHCFDPAAPSPQRAPVAAPAAQAVFGDFVLDGDVALVDVLELYGLPLPDALPDSALKERASLDAVIRSRVPRAVEGDVLKLGGITLTVREMREGRVLRVGFKLPGR
jgi:potassium/hydrogen antiporter